ncbi:methionyl-tRNA formyltransferase [Thermoproteota archaeon]
MRIIFFGSGKIAVPSLQAALKKHEIVSVVTAPDSKSGRHLKLSFSPIKEFCLEKEIQLIQPSKLTSKSFVDDIVKSNPEVFVVFAYGKKLPGELLQIPSKMAVNIHASLLPKYRGAAPINWALINGEDLTGITAIRMNEEIDQGDSIFEKSIKIDPNDDAVTLEEKLSALSVQFLPEILDVIESDKISYKKQNAGDVSYAPKLIKEHGRINWKLTAHQIRNLIRGCIPWPGAFTSYKDSILKIWSADVIENPKGSKYAVGTIISLQEEGIAVATLEKSLLIKELQISSGKRLKSWQFLQGHELKPGDMFV